MDNSGPAPFLDESSDPTVRGFLHLPNRPNGDGLVLTHGAGSNCGSPLLVALAEVFASKGYTVLRCDLPYRQQRRTGPPFPGNADRDRAGLRSAVAAMKKHVTGRIFLGGHSYGARQSSMLVAGEPDLVSGLLLLSYPLHPPRKPDQLRTQHLPKLGTDCLFVQGTRDPFGSIAEIDSALQLISAQVKLMPVEGAGHDLRFKAEVSSQSLANEILIAFESMFG